MQRSTSTAVLRHFAGNAIVTLLAAWWVIFGIEFLIEGFTPGLQTTSAVSSFPVYISNILKYVPLELVALSFGLMHMTLGVASLGTTMHSEGSERRKRTTSQGEL